jgi:hypothetical protein
MTKSRNIYTPRKPWTKSQLATLRREYPNRQTKLIAEKIGHSVSSTYQKALKLGLHKSAEYLASPASGRLDGKIGSAHRFHKGQISWNRGMHWAAGGRSAETRFKPGQLNGRARQLLKPLGTMRVNADGYLEQKITNEGSGGRRWKAVHRLVWEREHGPVPVGHVVVFKPGRRATNPEEITLDAVELVTREELMQRNTVHRYPKQIAQLIQLKGAVQRQINKRDRERAEQNR